MGKDLFDLASGISDDDIVNESVKLLPHNQKLYNSIVEQLNKGEHSIFYSEGTGLGKSYILMKLVHEVFAGKHVLYVVPKHSIWKNLVHYSEFSIIENQMTEVTFAAFNSPIVNDSYFFEFDVVFVDECHHMLSDIQGKNVKQFLDDMVSRDKYVFGMTATPEIEGVFVDEECFDISCYGLDMFEAIEQGLMPKMDIAIGIKEDIDIPDNLREQYSVIGTKTLLETVIDDYKHVTHWLAYFTTKEELEQNKSELRKLFPEFKILKAYHGLDNTEEVIAEFENSRQPVILMTVSMFLEGMHLDNVGGVLLYRNVQKGHTYAQILGRLCVIGQKQAPVMVDIPGSVLSIKQFYTPKSSRASNTQRKVYERKDVFNVTAKSYKLFDLMAELGWKEYRGVRWRNTSTLESSLGRAGRHAFISFRFNHPGVTEEDYIDFVLKDSSYEEFVNDGYCGYYKLDKYKYTDYKDLSLQLGLHESAVATYVKNYGPLTTLEDLEKHTRARTDNAPKYIREPGVVYKGVDLTSSLTAGRCLNKGRTTVEAWCSKHGNCSLRKYVDYVQSKESTKDEQYKGVLLNTTRAELAKALDVPLTTLNNRLSKEGLDRRKVIDFFLNKQNRETLQ